MRNETLRHARAALALGLTLGLMAGCAHSKQGREEASDASPNTISAEEIERSPEASVAELLEGKVAGVRVLRKGNGVIIRIRGRSSIHGSNQPLYVVDGLPTEPGPGGVLNINVHDIHSIRVLKNPSETAFYGVRGANGVILITTKDGGN